MGVMTTHETIRALIEIYNVPQDYLAKLCGVSQPTISRWYNSGAGAVKHDAHLALDTELTHQTYSASHKHLRGLK